MYVNLTFLGGTLSPASAKSRVLAPFCLMCKVITVTISPYIRHHEIRTRPSCHFWS